MKRYGQKLTVGNKAARGFCRSREVRATVVHHARCALINIYDRDPRGIAGCTYAKRQSLKVIKAARLLLITDMQHTGKLKESGDIGQQPQGLHRRLSQGQ